jgi:general transcriptional corepressor TUP1
MYNSHRGMGPAPGNSRLNELLDQVRAEFETQARASGEYEHSSKSLVTQAVHFIPFLLFVEGQASRRH